MNITFSKIRYFTLILLFFLIAKVNADDYPFKISSNQESQILVESNNQSSDLNNSIFFAEGNVKITSADNEFVAKSNKAIFYKSIGKIKLIGNAEIITKDLNKVKAAEIIYFLSEKKFEAISDENQRVKTTFDFND